MLHNASASRTPTSRIPVHYHFNPTGSCDVQKPKLGGANTEIYFLRTKTFFPADHAKMYSQGDADSNALEAESA